jgi:hypothetical protein
MAIRTRISLRRAEPADDEPTITSENRYPYAEVLKVGQSLINEANDGDTSSRNARTVSSKGVSVKAEIKESMDDIVDRMMTGLQDVLKVQAKATNEQFGSVLKAMQATSASQTPTYHQSSQNSPPVNPPQLTQNRGWNQPSNRPSFTSLDEMMCYFCDRSGHMIRNCPERQEMIDEGLLIERDGRTLLKDGGPIPRFPVEVSQKQRVEKFYEKLHKQEAERRSVNMMESISIRGVIPVATMPQISTPIDPRDAKIAELERLIKSMNVQTRAQARHQAPETEDEDEDGFEEQGFRSVRG